MDIHPLSIGIVLIFLFVFPILWLQNKSSPTLF